MTLTIEMTSDFICPWCLVADTNLQKAIAQLDIPVAIQRIWYPFELNPDMPEAGMDRKTYRTNKFGSWEYSQQLDAKTVQAGQANGIEFRYDLMKVTPNTLKAHRLTWFAGKAGKATDMAERIFRAYFTEGQDIGDVDTLVNLAAEIGLDSAQVKTFLLSQAGIQDVEALKRRAIAQGIRSVPTIRIGNEVLVGGQPTEIFLAALRSAATESEKV
ncbi:DsbA family oxidoreductase [Fischerella thermalis CCMEE 5273]|uniref:Polyketide biosynthesis protein n=1 Tax=Chlorogloeopsis fritschii PCC 6912 TaxID=211165 RepID=A0A3S1FQF9_CHLFR|nr:DsbA family oxidoreductase [Chlorogloeopsis fritschii]PMB06404.1 DsbA family oxidoreductase [Fischerella thermalis CCMEE 5273]PMB49970.1 DsbA family oxidoreductase [Fischerella thermalis CCMEE 5205]RUR83677.1 polyketide biosynthesis protein [Chlorogloeopsis fritschii PCC 6912]